MRIFKDYWNKQGAPTLFFYGVMYIGVVTASNLLATKYCEVKTKDFCEDNKEICNKYTYDVTPVDAVKNNSYFLIGFLGSMLGIILSMLLFMVSMMIYESFKFCCKSETSENKDETTPLGHSTFEVNSQSSFFQKWKETLPSVRELLPFILPSVLFVGEAALLALVNSEVVPICQPHSCGDYFRNITLEQSAKALEFSNSLSKSALDLGSIFGAVIWAVMIVGVIGISSCIKYCKEREVEMSDDEDHQGLTFDL